MSWNPFWREPYFLLNNVAYLAALICVIWVLCCPKMNPKWMMRWIGMSWIVVNVCYLARIFGVGLMWPMDGDGPLLFGLLLVRGYLQLFVPVAILTIAAITRYSISDYREGKGKAWQFILYWIILFVVVMFGVVVVSETVRKMVPYPPDRIHSMPDTAPWSR